MPVSYKRKNSMKKSKSSKGSKSSKLSKRVKTPKNTKPKKRLTRKSKNGSVVRKMRGGADNIRIPNLGDEITFYPPHPKLGGIIYIINYIEPENEYITDNSIIHFVGKSENVGLRKKTWGFLKNLESFKYVNQQQE